MNAPNITILKIITYRHGITFHVQGETGKNYIVDYNFHKGWICDCPHHLFRKVFCKHMEACKEYVSSKGLELPVELYCHNPKADEVMV